MTHTQLLKIIILIIFNFQFSILNCFAQPSGSTKITGLCSVPSFWINTTTDDAGPVQWQINTTTITNTTNKTDGRDNTNGYAWMPGTAGYICNNKPTGSIGGAWYLPSQEELAMVYSAYKAGALSGFTNSSYWSSTETSSTYAWFVKFYDGAVVDDNVKTARFYVRCAWRP